MEQKDIIELIRNEIQSYSDVNAPEKRALAILITKIEENDK